MRDDGKPTVMLVYGPYEAYDPKKVCKPTRRQKWWFGNCEDIGLERPIPREFEYMGQTFYLYHRHTNEMIERDIKFYNGAEHYQFYTEPTDIEGTSKEQTK